jgi:uncharacterized protein
MNADPLNDAEVEELDHFLLYAEGLEESMSISELDGFLTAIVIGPSMVAPSEWIRWVWDMERGERSPEFKDAAQASRIVELLMRHMNGIARTLDEAPQEFEPLLMENPNQGDPIPILDEWCTGFMKGVEIDSSEWLPVTAGKPEWLSTIRLYGTEEGWDQLEKRDLSLDEHRALAADLASEVRNIHHSWREIRRRQIAEGRLPAVVRHKPVRNPMKVGRNEPCPCGSGKKYKHCHGAPGTLH